MELVKALHLSLIGLSSIILVYRFRSLRRHPGDPAVRALFLMLLMFQVAFVLGDPASYWFLHRLTGELPGIPQLFQHMAGMGMAYYVEVLIIWVVTPASDTVARALRAQRLLLSGALVVVVVCYVLGPLRLGIPILDPRGYQDWGITAYIIAWQAYIAVALVDTIRLRRRHAGAGRPYLRIGLNLLAVGYVFVAVQIVHKIGYQLASGAGVRLPWAESGPQGVQMFMILPIVICYSLGLTIPSQGPKVELWWRRRRAYRRIAPMVDALRAVVPAPVPVATRALRDRLRQQIVLVRDVVLGPLRDHLDPGVYDRARESASAAGLTDAEALAVAEAAYLAAAVRAKAAGAPAGPSRASLPALSTRDDLDAEAAWLAEVGQAYVGSRTVREVLAET